MAQEGDVIRLPDTDPLRNDHAFQVFHEGQWRNLTLRPNIVDMLWDIHGNGRNMQITDETLQTRDEQGVAEVLRFATRHLYGIDGRRPEIDTATREELGRRMGERIDRLARETLLGERTPLQPTRAELEDELDRMRRQVLIMQREINRRDAAVQDHAQRLADEVAPQGVRRRTLTFEEYDAHIERQNWEIEQLRHQRDLLRNQWQQERARNNPIPQEPGAPPTGTPATMAEALIDEANRRVEVRGDRITLEDLERAFEEFDGLPFAGPAQEALFEEVDGLGAPREPFERAQTGVHEDVFGAIDAEWEHHPHELITDGEAQLLPHNPDRPQLGYNFKCHWRPNE